MMILLRSLCSYASPIFLYSPFLSLHRFQPLQNATSVFLKINFWRLLYARIAPVICTATCGPCGKYLFIWFIKCHVCGFCNVFRKYPLFHSALFHMKMIKENHMFFSIFLKICFKVCLYRIYIFIYTEYTYIFWKFIFILLIYKCH